MIKSFVALIHDRASVPALPDAAFAPPHLRAAPLRACEDELLARSDR